MVATDILVSLPEPPAGGAAIWVNILGILTVSGQWGAGTTRFHAPPGISRRAGGGIWICAQHLGRRRHPLEASDGMERFECWTKPFPPATLPPAARKAEGGHAHEVWRLSCVGSICWEHLILAAGGLSSWDGVFRELPWLLE